MAAALVVPNRPVLIEYHGGEIPHEVIGSVMNYHYGTHVNLDRFYVWLYDADAQPARFVRI